MTDQPTPKDQEGMTPFLTIIKTKKGAWKMYGGWRNGSEIIYSLSGRDGGTTMAAHYLGGATLDGIIMPEEMIPQKYKDNRDKIISNMRNWNTDRVKYRNKPFLVHSCKRCECFFEAADGVHDVCQVCFYQLESDQ